MDDFIFFSPKISNLKFFLVFLLKHSVGVEYKIPEIYIWFGAGNTKGGSITVLLTSCFTGLESVV
jgi:hypothetical protein